MDTKWYAIIILAITLVSLLGWWIWHYSYKVPNDLKKFALQFFLKNMSNYKLDQLKTIQKIHLGYTNVSFYIEMNDGCQFQLRFAKNNQIVDRKNEERVLELLGKSNYVYLDQYGNYIKKWVKGRNLEKKEITPDFILKLNEKITNFHQIKVQDDFIVKHDYNKVNLAKKVPKKYLSIYNQCLNLLDKKDWVLSHNDLNLDNILINDNEIIFIDFEWTRINHPYWDIANFCRETEFSHEQLKRIAQQVGIPDEQFFYMYFICLCYAYNWTFENSFSFKIWKYRLKTLKQIVLMANILK